MNYKGFQIEPIEQSCYDNGNRDYIVKDGDKSTIVMNSNPEKLIDYVDAEIERQFFEDINKKR